MSSCVYVFLAKVLYFVSDSRKGNDFFILFLSLKE